MRVVRVPFGCILALCLASASAEAEAGRTPTYTDDDLHRVSARRAETGVQSEPASSTDSRSSGPSRHEAQERKRGEAYWHAEAERVADRIRGLRQRADALRVQLEQQQRRQRETRATARRKPATTSVDTTIGLRQRLEAIEAEIREREARFEERARREGALPGWLR